MITQVDNLLWRGPRPQPTDYAAIKAQFKSIISLEGLDEDKKEMAELTPVPVISCPIGFKEIYFTGIIPAKLDGILTVIATAPKPVLLHCQHGQDRTGLIVACYRVKVSGWTKQAAWAEALKFGYRNWLNLGLNRTWEAFT
jgi:tyrosine-protein phosphatase SIW14